MGHARGLNCENIRRAEAIEGIVRVKGIGKGFIIEGTSKAAIEEARSILELTRRDVTIRKSMVGKIVGKKGATVKYITEKTGVVIIDTFKPKELDEQNVQINIIGYKTKIDKAVEIISEIVGEE